MDVRLDLGRLGSLPRVPQPNQGKLPNVGFLEVLNNTQNRGKDYRISGHAEKRISERKIFMDEPTKSILNETLNELSAKGAQNSLVVTQKAAFVFHVPSRTMVTAMDLNEVRNRLITKIDSVMIRNA